MASDQYIRRVAVSVDASDAAATRVQWAASLANLFGAKLTGMAAAKPFIPSYSPLGEELLNYQPEILEAARRQVEAAVKAAEQIFESGCQSSDHAWTSSVQVNAVSLMLQEAASNDLLITGRHGSGDLPDHILGADPSEIILQAGRPLMVLPPKATQFSLSRVLIAWKPGREARRAVMDALPYLSRAQEVWVCAIGDDDAERDSAGILSFLQAHGHAAKLVAEPRHERTDSAAILDVVERVHADLIVAGAYGQSRFKEWVFGGVTRDLLDHATVPCLLSH